MENYITVFIAGLFSIIAAIAAGLISYNTARKSSEEEIKKLEHNFEMDRKSDVYLIKKDSILKTLKFIDTYLSWQEYDDNSIIPVREDTSLLSLSLTGRECYNNLCLTCQNGNILECLNSILSSDKDTNILKAYAAFRNAARLELGLEEITFDPDKVFYCRISTLALEKTQSINS